jgi:hypothetical protein
MNKNNPDNSTISISREDVHNLYQAIIGTSEESISILDLNKWLKSKTYNQYTIFSWQDIIEILGELDVLKLDLETTINSLKSLKTHLNIRYNLKQTD